MPASSGCCGIPLLAVDTAAVPDSLEPLWMGLERLELLKPPADLSQTRIVHSESKWDQYMGLATVLCGA